MEITDIGFEGRWSQPMIVISSTKLAKSLDGRSGAGLPSIIQRPVGTVTKFCRPVPELDYRGSGVCHQTAAGHGDVQSDDAVHGLESRSTTSSVLRPGTTGRNIQSPPAAPDGEGLLACLARYARVAVYRELQPYADQIDGVTRHDSGAASHLHSGGRKAACYEGRKPTEFDAISNQRRDRGAGGAVRDQVV